ncbi:methyl-accepting chemotaxis protein [Lacrimispora celerecrescens]|uniref:Chemotaxis protein n=1 Tax=Lacrimispora celerecrescens TaxID=29354 RepID=A0A084JSG4_9FIRM|nr:HAMP domain-containing methyl-accepting chemotaxis protein [Lacrimispora celerecrescens]KEZ91898.1 chemotaxis protein [Lacrimispora celerecrescens]
MKKFKDYSITKKLLTAFLSMVFIMLVIGITGVLGMSQINKMDTFLYKEQTVPMKDLIIATKNLYQLRVDANAMASHAGDTMELEALEKSYAEAKNNFLSSSAEYRTSIKNDEALALIDEATQLFTDSFDPSIQKCLNAAKQGSKDTALHAFDNEKDNIQKMFDNFDKLVDVRMRVANETSKTNDSTAILLTGVLSIILLAGAAIAIFLGLRISRMISLPIGQIVKAADKIALGHVDVDLKDVDSKDETGQLAASFTTMLAGIRDQVLIAEKISNGDFTQEVPLRSEDDVLGLALRKIEKDLNRTLLLINTAADQVNSGAGQVSSAAQALASGSTEQAATVEELNAAIATVAKQASQNADNVRLASEYVEQNAAGVNESNIRMQSLNASMNKINATSEEISSITKVIEDIAFQTNILALNAAIEAARAGSAGKGFAVVADEVRNLATKSAEAAKETANLIVHSVEAVTEGRQMSVDAAKILQEVEEKSRFLEQAIREIESASSQQVVAIDQINQGLSQVSAVIQTNAATAEESSASSEELAAQSETLQQEVGKFKLNGEQTDHHKDYVPSFESAEPEYYTSTSAYYDYSGKY